MGTEDDDWLLLIGADGLVQAVDGGAPASWVMRHVNECAGLPAEVQAAARRLARDATQAAVRRIRVPRAEPGSPSFTLLAVEAILVRPAEVDVRALIQRALEPLVRQAESSGIGLRIEASSEADLSASLDAPKIVWAVTTLVGNALRYVRRGGLRLPGGHITVRLARAEAPRMLRITVEDDGPGIPSGVLSRLLPGSGDGDALGVALRLVHEVVIAHRGGMVIKSSSEPEDRGTEITLWLPLGG